MIPMEDQSVDFVLCLACIERLPTYLDALNLLLEINRVLKPNGKLLIVAPNYLSGKDQFYDDFKHSWVTTPRRLRVMLETCGFKLFDLRYSIGWITMSRSLLLLPVKIAVSILLYVLRLNIVMRLGAACKLDTLILKIKKTLFELIVIVGMKAEG